MFTKKWILILMALTALAQIGIPIVMVIDSEHILDDGIPNKIRTAPVDPNDPFRGKYISLDFENDYFVIEDDTDWKRNDLVYVLFQKDSFGFATIKAITKNPPSESRNYIKTSIQRVSYYSNRGHYRVYVDFPFDRFYMEESKAPKAERLYNTGVRQDSAEVYALLMVEDGNFILKDVFYNGISIGEMVRE